MEEKDLFSIIKRIIVSILIGVFSYYYSLFDPFYASVSFGLTMLFYFFVIIDWVYARPSKSLARILFPKIILGIILLIFLIFNWLILTFIPIYTKEALEGFWFLEGIIIISFTYIAYLLLHKIEKDLSSGKGNIKLAEKFRRQI